MKIKNILFSLLFLLLGACNQSLQLKVKSDVPAPLVKQYPLSVGIHFTDEFRNFIYKEDSRDRPGWHIESGLSQVQLFNRVLPSMFQSVQEVGLVNALSVAAVFKPEVEEMQFAMPEEKKTEFYEVWIKYNIQLLNTDGKMIANWPVVGYGKSSTEFLESNGEGLNSAFNRALRDAGAKFSLNFEKNNDVKQWLSELGICEQTSNNC